LITINNVPAIRFYAANYQYNEGWAVAEQETYWQQEDRSTIGKVFLMVGVFAVVMAVVAVVVGFIL
jgi:hypothetical protein